MPKLDRSAELAFLRKCDIAYNSGLKLLLSDKAYDRRRDRAKQRWPNDPYFKKISAPLRSDGRVEVKLPVRMHSLDKKRPNDAAKWVMGLPKGTEFFVTPKLDGIALLLEYHNGKFRRAFTRGEDGVTGFEVTQNAQHIQGVISKFRRSTGYASPIGESYIFCEVIIHKKIFADKYKGKSLTPNGKPYKAARNFCIGMINRLHLQKVHEKALADMTCIAYNIAKKNKDKMEYFDKADAIGRLSLHGFTTITKPTRDGSVFLPLENFWYPDGKKITGALLSGLLQQWRQRYDILQDGLVIDINQNKIRQQHGFNESRPGYTVAVKPEVEDQISKIGKVASLDIQMSSRRLFIPVWVLANKLDFDGVEVERITANNCGELLRSLAGPGAEIRIVRSGDVIPHYLETVKTAGVPLPTRCPYCSTKLQWTKTKGVAVHLYCPNERCPGPKLRMLRRFFTVLKVDGMAKGVIEAMVAVGLDTVPKILTATPRQLRRVEGFGERKTDKIISGLRRLVQDMSLAVLMKASGMLADETMGFGIGRLDPIIKALGQRMILSGRIDKNNITARLLQIPGIGERVAERFVEGLPDFRAFYQEIQNIVTLAKDGKPKAGPLAGKIITFTGFRPKPELQERIVKLGGEWNDSYSARRTSVLFSSSLTTGKAIKAAENGTRIVMQNKVDDYLRTMEQR